MEKEEPRATFDVDKVIEFIGPLGKWQFIQAIFLFSLGATTGLCSVSFAFTGFMPNYRCFIPQCESQSASYDHINKTFIDKCSRIEFDGSSLMSCDDYLNVKLERSDNAWIAKCSREEIIFDRSIVKTSIPEDFDMICENSYQKSIFSSLYTLGLFLGSFIFGFISDCFGRKRAISISIFLIYGCGLIMTVIKNKPSLAIFRVIYGIGAKGCVMVAYVLAAESTTPRHKILLMFIAAIGYHVGEVIFPVEAYFVREWIPLQLISHGPLILLFISSLFVAESPRWLLSNGQCDKAIKVMEKRAAVDNIKDIPDEYFEPTKEAISSKCLGFLESLEGIVKHKKLLVRSLIMSLLWFSASLGFYGTLYASTSLSGDIHLNFILAMFSGVPGNLLYLILPDKIGRKGTFILVEIVLGVCCIGTGILLHFDAYMPLQIILSMLGRFVAGVAVKMCYLCTAELYPTPIRNTAIGIGSAVGGVGAIIGFLLEILGDFWISFPVMIVGICNLFTSVIVLFLPETKGIKLPETLDDVKNYDIKSAQGA